jgi:hypothetical protein
LFVCFKLDTNKAELYEEVEMSVMAGLWPAGRLNPSKPRVSLEPTIFGASREKKWPGQDNKCRAPGGQLGQTRLNLNPSNLKISLENSRLSRHWPQA